MGAAMKLKNLSILLTLSFIIGISTNLFANMYGESFGFSAEGLARGNAMTAVVNDWSSVFYNVGGLGKTQNIKGAPIGEKGGEMTLKLRKAEDSGGDSGQKEFYPNQIAIGCLYVFPKLDLKIKRFGTTASGQLVPINTKAAKMDPYGFITIGAAVDLNNLVKMPDIVSSARLGVALALNSDFSVAKVNDIDPRTHNFIRFGREIQRMVLMIGAGLGFLNDAFGGGIGMASNFNGKGKMFMEAQLTANPQVPVAQTTMDLGIAPAAVAGIYISPGRLFSVIDGLELGASYRMENKMKVEPFDAAASILGGVINMNLMLEIFDYYAPHIITGGIAYTRWGLTVSADVNYEMWSKMQVGKSAKYHYFAQPKYNNTIVPKVGIKYVTPVTWLAVLVGYSYVPSILAKSAGTTYAIRLGTVQNTLQTGMYNAMDNNKHVASLGFTFTIPKMWRLGGMTVITTSYQFQYLVPKSVQKNGMSYDLTTKAQDPALLNAYLLNPSYKYGGMNHSIFVEVGMKI
jgi:hypothetical protein